MWFPLCIVGLPFFEDDEKDTSDDTPDDKGAEDTPEESEETEDTPDEEEEATEDSDDTDAEDSGDDEEADTGDDSDDGGDLLRQYARDPKSVKPELRAAVKKLLGSYTRKMQAASRVLDHATAFQQLTQDPGFKKWVKQRQLELSKGRKREDDDEDDSDNKSGLTRETLREEVRAALAERNADEDSQKEFTQFKKDNPDWKVYRFDMHDIMGKHPTYTFQDAYDHVTRSNKSSAKRNKLKKDKKDANSEKPNKTGARGAVGKPKGKMTIRRAMEIAAKKLGVSMDG